MFKLILSKIKQHLLGNVAANAISPWKLLETLNILENRMKNAIAGI